MEVLTTGPRGVTPRRRSELISLARMRAMQYSIDPALVCAVIDRESQWDQWAFNPEPRYRYFWNVTAWAPFRKVTDAEIASEIPPADFPCMRGEDRDAEWWGQQMSYGLMQVMGAVGRECGFRGPFLTQLCDIDTCLEYGCAHLAKKLEHSGGDVARALQAWNGGGNPNYAAEVTARLGNYR